MYRDTFHDSRFSVRADNFWAMLLGFSRCDAVLEICHRPIGHTTASGTFGIVSTFTYTPEITKAIRAGRTSLAKTQL